MTQSYGKVLKQELEAEKQSVWETIQRRDERIRLGETDEEDCFLSMRVEQNHISEINKKLEVLKGDGFMEIDAYFDHDDKEVFPRLAKTKYGMRWVLDGVFAHTLQQLYKKFPSRGLYTRKVRVPVWVRISAGAGGGMCAVYSASPEYCRSHVNRVDGKNYCVHTNGQEISYTELSDGVYITLLGADKAIETLYHKGINPKGDTMIFTDKAAAVAFITHKGLPAEAYKFRICKKGNLTAEEAI